MYVKMKNCICAYSHSMLVIKCSTTFQLQKVCASCLQAFLHRHNKRPHNIKLKHTSNKICINIFYFESVVIWSEEY